MAVKLVPKTSSQGNTLWWEEDFYSGKLVAFPGKKPGTNVGSTAKFVEQVVLGPLDIVSEFLESSDWNVSLTEDGRQGCCVFKVPSLVNLCVNRLLLKCEHTEEVLSSVPPGLCPQVRRHERRQVLEKKQLTWLLNELVNREKVISSLQLSTFDLCAKFFRYARSFWVTDSNVRQELQEGEFLMNSLSCCYLPVAVEGRDRSSCNWGIAALAHAVEFMLPYHLLIDDKDPVTVRSGTCDDSFRGSLQHALVDAVNKVKEALSMLCPKLVHYCFDTSIAYVWWARGDIFKAGGMFRRIVEQTKYDDAIQELGGWQSQPNRFQVMWTPKYKALCLNELGRMHTYFGQPGLASEFYQQAAYLVSSQYPDLASDFLMQSRVLISSAYDQGMMGDALITRAKELWDGVTSDPECYFHLMQMAAESFLHCHTSHTTTTTTKTPNNKTVAWLQEARMRLSSLAIRAPQIFLHLSFVLAMLGKDEEAEDAYMNYVQQFASDTPALLQKIPGAISVFIGAEIKPHPWWVISEWLVSSAGKVGAPRCQCVDALPLLWKKNFRYCSCDMRTNDGEEDADCKVAEVQGRDPCLRLTSDGLLTGCLTQNLPPLRPLLLDPYTGKICIKEQFIEDAILPWRNYHNNHHGNTRNLDEFSFSLHTFIPTPILIYENSKAGVTVSLLYMHLNSSAENGSGRDRDSDREEVASSDVELSYSGLDGTRTLDLVHVFLEARKKQILLQLKNDGYGDDMMEEASDFLDICLLGSREMQYDFLKRALNQDCPERDALLGVKRQVGSMPSECAKLPTGTHRKKLLQAREDKLDLEPEVQRLILQGVRYVGQSTVILAFSASSNKYCVHGIDVLVFIDCTSQETFGTPVIRFPEKLRAVLRLPSQDYCMDNSAQISIACEEYQDERRLFVFDVYGNVVETHDNWSVVKAVVVSRKVAVPVENSECGDMVLHANKTKSCLQLMSSNGTIQFQTKPLGIIEDFLLADSMIFVSLRDRILILDSTTLEHVTIEHTEACSGAGPQVQAQTKSTGILLTGERSFLRLLSVKKLSATSSAVKDECTHQVILGVANHVFVLQRARHVISSADSVDASMAPVSVLASIIVPGVPTEACYISQVDGFLVTASVFQDQHLPLYRENLYWFDMAGNIRGIHPFLGPGPHGLFAAQLKDVSVKREKDEHQMMHGNEQLSAGTVHMNMAQQWYIYFADGLGALCCIKL